MRSSRATGTKPRPGSAEEAARKLAAQFTGYTGPRPRPGNADDAARKLAAQFVGIPG
jgi:hypothetical protein